MSDSKQNPIIAPCKDCPDRCLYCHSHCEKYAEYKERCTERLKNVRAENNIRGMAIERQIRLNDKRRKRH